MTEVNISVDSDEPLDDLQVTYLFDGSEFAAMAELGYGVPILSPELGRPEPGLESLRERGLVDETGSLAPLFGAMWKVAVMPQILGEVTRFHMGHPAVWFYFVSLDAFVEEVVSHGQALLVGCKLETLPLRLALNTGLLVDSSRGIDLSAMGDDDPRARVTHRNRGSGPSAFEYRFGLKFTNVLTGCRFSLETRRVGPDSWEVGDRRLRAIDLIELIATGISDLFGLE